MPSATLWAYLAEMLFLFFVFVAASTLVGAKPFHLLMQTAHLLESPAAAFIAAQPQGRSKHIFTGGGVTANGICCRWLPAGERTLSGASRQLSRRESQGRNGSASCLSLWERWLRPSGADGEGAPAPLRGAAAATRRIQRVEIAATLPR